jgi:hypothetical protein
MVLEALTVSSCEAWMGVCASPSVRPDCRNFDMADYHFSTAGGQRYQDWQKDLYGVKSFFRRPFLDSGNLGDRSSSDDACRNVL